jgi:hypothetical protein
MTEAQIFLIKPQQVRGLFMTGTPAKREYLELLPELKDVLNTVDYVFASVSMIYKKGVVENGLPTLAVTFDERIVSPQQYSQYVDSIGTKVLDALRPSGTSINIVVLDRANKFLQHFMKHPEWLINIKEKGSVVSFKKLWWQFW